jgi:hypothetical protein
MREEPTTSEGQAAPTGPGAGARTGSVGGTTSTEPLREPPRLWHIDCTVLVRAESLEGAEALYETMTDALPEGSVNFSSATVGPVPEEES